MESPRKVRDPTYYHRIHTRNTYNHVFPLYLPKITKFMSSTQTSFTKTLDFSQDSEFVTHNKDTLNKRYNKKVDRIVDYTESMLKIRDLSKLNRR